MTKNYLRKDGIPRQSSSLNDARKKKGSIFVCTVISSLIGVAAGACALLLMSALLTKSADPTRFFSLCALISVVVAGFAAGKASAIKMPDNSRVLRIFSVWSVLALIVVILSLVFPAEKLGETSESVYFSIGSLAAMLAGAFLGSRGKRKKSASKGRR